MPHLAPISMGVPPSLSSPVRTVERRRAMAIVFVAFVISVSFGQLSTGTWQWDELCRFLMARWAWNYPKYFLYDWAHPGFVAAYFLPSQLGWGAARVFSAVLS